MCYGLSYDIFLNFILPRGSRFNVVLTSSFTPKKLPVTCACQRHSPVGIPLELWKDETVVTLIKTGSSSRRDAFGRHFFFVRFIFYSRRDACGKSDAKLFHRVSQLPSQTLPGFPNAGRSFPSRIQFGST